VYRWAEIVIWFAIWVSALIVLACFVNYGHDTDRVVDSEFRFWSTYSFVVSQFISSLGVTPMFAVVMFGSLYVLQPLYCIAICVVYVILFVYILVYVCPANLGKSLDTKISYMPGLASIIALACAPKYYVWGARCCSATTAMVVHLYNKRVKPRRKAGANVATAP
jgi:hypothetical protein